MLKLKRNDRVLSYHDNDLGEVLRPPSYKAEAETIKAKLQLKLGKYTVHREVVSLWKIMTFHNVVHKHYNPFQADERSTIFKYKIERAELKSCGNKSVAGRYYWRTWHRGTPSFAGAPNWTFDHEELIGIVVNKHLVFKAPGELYLPDGQNPYLDELNQEVVSLEIALNEKK